MAAIVRGEGLESEDCHTGPDVKRLQQSGGSKERADTAEHLLLESAIVHLQIGNWIEVLAFQDLPTWR